MENTTVCPFRIHADENGFENKINNNRNNNKIELKLHQQSINIRLMYRKRMQIMIVYNNFMLFCVRKEVSVYMNENMLEFYCLT